VVGLVAMLVAAAIVAPQVIAHDGDVSALLRVGRYSASRPFVEQSFDDPPLTEDYGHDGQQFYVLAATFPHAHDAIPFVDRIRYRFRRVVFPALVSPAPAGAPLVWTMFAVNLLAIGAMAVALARLSTRLGGTPWLGLLAGLDPALVESLQGSLADGLAVALALWGVVLWRKHIGWAVVLFTLAALTRETTLVAAAACFVVGDRRQRRWLLIPPAAFLAWMATVSVWLPATPGQDRRNILQDATGELTVPFRAWVHLGLGSTSIVLGLVLLAASLVAAWKLRHRLPEVSLWLLFDAVLLVCSDEGVAERPLNLARVAALALPAVGLALVVERHPGGATPPGRSEPTAERAGRARATSHAEVQPPSMG
jgi:hypothetical protein